MAHETTNSGAAATCSASGCAFGTRTYPDFRTASSAAAQHANKAQRESAKTGDDTKHWVAVVNLKETVRVYGPKPVETTADYIGAK